MSVNYQELAESIVIGALRGGGLAAMEFRHDDSGDDSETDVIIVKSGPPTQELRGPRGYRMEVSIDIKSKTPEANAATHGEVLDRVTNGVILHAAAIAAGMAESDDLYTFPEEMTGDRDYGPNLRRRSISFPIQINRN